MTTRAVSKLNRWFADSVTGVSDWIADSVTGVSDWNPKFNDVLLWARSTVLAQIWSIGQSYTSSTSLLIRSKSNSIWISNYNAPNNPTSKLCHPRLCQIRLSVKSALFFGLWVNFGCVPSFFMKSHQHNFCILWNSLQLCFRCHLHAKYLTSVS